eukprot:TRINITY_DN42025_c0_g1_i1.p1 TRINITY_DN42025_c0_g1~~TRINITY_DN42025_c0_g1_i1.p1  ORF type:complete len:188 (+),score=9.99 TRINITY_DN42025_c0_g1_i1:38-601(+)
MSLNDDHHTILIDEDHHTNNDQPPQMPKNFTKIVGILALVLVQIITLILVFHNRGNIHAPYTPSTEPVMTKDAVWDIVLKETPRYHFVKLTNSMTCDDIGQAFLNRMAIIPRMGGLYDANTPGVTTNVGYAIYNPWRSTLDSMIVYDENWKNPTSVDRRGFTVCNDGSLLVPYDTEFWVILVSNYKK